MVKIRLGTDGSERPVISKSVGTIVAFNETSFDESVVLGTTTERVSLCMVKGRKMFRGERSIPPRCTRFFYDDSPTYTLTLSVSFTAGFELSWPICIESPYRNGGLVSVRSVAKPSR